MGGNERGPDADSDPQHAVPPSIGLVEYDLFAHVTTAASRTPEGTRYLDILFELTRLEARVIDGASAIPSESLFLKFNPITYGVVAGNYAVATREGRLLELLERHIDGIRGIAAMNGIVGAGVPVLEYLLGHPDTLAEYESIDTTKN